MTTTAELDLTRHLASEHVLDDPDVVARYETDWTGRWSGRCRAVVRPGSTAEVAAVLTACSTAGVPVVVQGGNTGLVGGAVPSDGAVVLSTERLRRVRTVDAQTGRVRVGAGATLAEVEAAATDAGWTLGVDLASRDTATIGGMVATDAGGARVVAHGSMGDHVLGLEVVFADGTVARPWMEGLPKDTAGYDLRALLVGSEGTLGIVTEALLQLVRPTPATATLLLGASFGHLPTMVAALRERIASSPVQLTGCELLTSSSCRLVADVLGLTSPLTTEAAVLVDLAGDVRHDLLHDLDDLSQSPAIVALDAPQRARLWEMRERHTEAIATLGVPVKLDVAVPLEQLALFLHAVRATVATVLPSAQCVLFGHAAEGNVHVNVTGAADHARRVESVIYDLVEDCGGTISAEHGIGRAKVMHLSRTRDPGSIEVMRAVKDALDPRGVLNPGVVFPLRPRS